MNEIMREMRAIHERESIPKPRRIAKLPTDPRGYPIFFTAQQPDGSYDFRAIYGPTIVYCANHRVCGLCGEPMGAFVFFVGGPKSVKSRLYSDPPMHEDCALYAFRVCPYLLRGGWDRTHRQDMQEWKEVDPHGTPEKPAAMALVRTNGYEFHISETGAPLFRANSSRGVRWMVGEKPV